MTIERDRHKHLEEEEFSKTMTYFGELEDALSHYSSCLPEGMFMTVTVRTNENGEATAQLVTETNFPPLDDLQNHFEKLKLAASELDRLPKSYWEDMYDHQLGTKKRPIPTHSVANCPVGFISSGSSIYTSCRSLRNYA